MTIRVLVADDEPPARARVRAMLQNRPGYRIVGEAGDGAAAVDVVVREAPDLIFLDVTMPQLDGFEVIDALEATGGVVPTIVFVTAFDEFALRAFEVGAIDYLLKPFDQDRFDRALARVAARGPSAAALPEALRSFLEGLGARRAFPARFLVRTGRRMQFVRVEELDWIDGRGNYLRLHVGGRTHLVRETMQGMEEKLDPAAFVRVHRSVIVRIDRIGSVEPYRRGDFLITMRDGACVRSSAAYKHRLRDLLR